MRLRIFAVALLLTLWQAPSLAFAASGANYAVQGGWFYTEANGQGGGPGQVGYAVTDEDGVPFYAQFQAGGGVASFGFPVSPRLTYAGFTSQLFQKAVFQWSGSEVALVNVLDTLHQAGKDDWLQATYQVPAPESTDADSGLSPAAVLARHQSFLDSDPALRAAYFAAGDPVALYGVPTSRPVAALNGQEVVVRLQRAVLQRWTVDTPWASAGQVTVANAGDILKASGLLPAEALAPQPAPLTTTFGPLGQAQVPTVAQVPGTAAPALITVRTLNASLLTTADLPSGFARDQSYSVETLRGTLDVFVQQNKAATMTGPAAIVEIGGLATSAAAAQANLAKVPSSVPASYGPLHIEAATPVPSIGQKTFAYRATFSAKGQNAEEYLVLYSEQNAVILIDVAGYTGTVTLAEAVKLAQLVDGRLTAQH